jgi:hypothetical protein
MIAVHRGVVAVTDSSWRKHMCQKAFESLLKLANPSKCILNARDALLNFRDTCFNTMKNDSVRDRGFYLREGGRGNVDCGAGLGILQTYLEEVYGIV